MNWWSSFPIIIIAKIAAFVRIRIWIRMFKKIMVFHLSKAFYAVTAIRSVIVIDFSNTSISISARAYFVKPLTTGDGDSRMSFSWSADEKKSLREKRHRTGRWAAYKVVVCLVNVNERDHRPVRPRACHRECSFAILSYGSLTFFFIRTFQEIVLKLSPYRDRSFFISLRQNDFVLNFTHIIKSVTFLFDCN